MSVNKINEISKNMLEICYLDKNFRKKCSFVKTRILMNMWTIWEKKVVYEINEILKGYKKFIVSAEIS